MSGPAQAGARAAAHALAHDLRGPVLTIDGFAAELRLATDELVRVASDGAGADATPRENDPAALRERVLDIARTDLLPCLECIAAAAATLGARVDALDGAAAHEVDARARTPAGGS